MSIPAHKVNTKEHPALAPAQTTLVYNNPPEHMLLINRIRTPDGTILQSTNRWDFVSHTDAATGEYYFTDGGSAYIRRSINKAEAESLDLYTDSPHEEIREVFTWGRNYDKDMNRLEQIEYILLKDMDTEHIKAIVDGGWSQEPITGVFLNELHYRGINYD
jgi:hypothetical protein